jgi:hypothetical protein
MTMLAPPASAISEIAPPAPTAASAQLKPPLGFDIGD